MERSTSMNKALETSISCLEFKEQALKIPCVFSSKKKHCENE